MKVRCGYSKKRYLEELKKAKETLPGESPAVKEIAVKTRGCPGGRV